MVKRILVSTLGAFSLTLNALALECQPFKLEYGLASKPLAAVLKPNHASKIQRWVTRQKLNIKGNEHSILMQAVPSDIAQQYLDLQFKGTGPAEYVICAQDKDGDSKRLSQGLLLGDRQEKLTFSNIQNQQLTFQVKGLAKTSQYHLELNLKRNPKEFEPWVPQKSAPMEPIQGFADLHIHQASSLAFAGGWYWGSHREGALSQRVPACLGHNHGTLNPSWLPTGLGLVDPHPHQNQGYPGFESWPRWNDIKHQQVAAQWLKDAHDKGLKVAMMSLVNNHWLASAMQLSKNADPSVPPMDMESIKLQLHSLKQMDAASPWYTIVRDPWEARRAIARGELAVILAVEVSDLFPSSDGPWREQLFDLYDMGVRSVQIAHQTNNRFSGAAYHRDFLKTLNQLETPHKPEVTPYEEGDGTHNPRGLTPEGYELLDEMVRLNMLVDLTHLPHKTQSQIYEVMANKHQFYPLYNSHTRFDWLLGPKEAEMYKEFTTTQESLAYYKKTGGVLGLRTGEEPMKSSPGAVANNCDGSTRSFLQTYHAAHTQGVALAFASDFNGFITQMAPRYGKDACPNAPNEPARKAQVLAQGQPPRGTSALQEFYEKGLAHAGLLPALVEDMTLLGAKMSPIQSSAEATLKMWERAYQTDRRALD